LHLSLVEANVLVDSSIQSTVICTFSMDRILCSHVQISLQFFKYRKVLDHVDFRKNCQ